MVEKLDISGIEKRLDAKVSLSYDDLTDTQREQLSQVLFPRTHTDEIDLCGKKRTLFPLTIKYAREIHVQAKPLMELAAKATESDELLSLDEPLLKCVFDAAKTIAKAHDDWGDVIKKIDDDDVVISELQNLIIQQESLQGANDFLLTPLRLAIKLMRAREMAEILQAEDFGGSLLTTPFVARSSAVASTS